jgi:hypothetical protein
VFPFLTILTTRLAVLKEVFPTFGPIQGQPLKDGTAFIRTTAEEIETEIRRFNQVHVDTTHSRRKDSDGGVTLLTTVEVSYNNLSGSRSFSENFGPFEGDDEAEAVEQAKNEAHALVAPRY